MIHMDLPTYYRGMTDVTQRRLRDSWGLIGVIIIATFYLANSVYQAVQQDWAAAGMQAALGALFLGVLVFSLTRRR